MAETTTTPAPPKAKKEVKYIVVSTMLGTRDPDTNENLVEGDVRPASVFGDALGRYKSLGAIKRYVPEEEPTESVEE